MATLSIGDATFESRLFPERFVRQAEDDAFAGRAAVRRAVNAELRANDDRRTGSLVTSPRTVADTLAGIDAAIAKRRIAWFLVSALAWLGLAASVDLALTFVRLAANGVPVSTGGFNAQNGVSLVVAGILAFGTCIVLARRDEARVPPLDEAIEQGAFEITLGKSRLYVGTYEGSSAHVREIRHDAIGKVLHDGADVTLLDRAGRTILAAKGVRNEDDRFDTIDFVTYVRSRIPA